jgi:hypothetical protein
MPPRSLAEKVHRQQPSDETTLCRSAPFWRERADAAIAKAEAILAAAVLRLDRQQEAVRRRAPARRRYDGAGPG